MPNSVPTATFFTADLFRGHQYSGNHPLAIPRVALTEDFIAACGGFGPDNRHRIERASIQDLNRFHSLDYLAALRRYDDAGPITMADRQQFNIGNFENPWFLGMYSVPATAAAGSILGARAVLNGQAAFNPAGGMHHAVPDRARGFCYINDVVLAVSELCDAGCRVVVADLDAHHGDGVEAAFADDPNVVLFSMHMDTATAYPRRGGRVTDVNAVGNSVNCPLPVGVNDAEFGWAFGAVWPSLMERVRPDAVVLVVGADVLAVDPLGKFNLSNVGALDVVTAVIQSAPRHANGSPRVLALGGGGYHPVALARYWAGVWGALAGCAMPDPLPTSVQALLAAHRGESDQLHATPSEMIDRPLDPRRPGRIRDNVRRRVRQLVASHPLGLSESSSADTDV